MPQQQIKFFQVGSFAAGNRLLDPARTVQSRTERSNTLTSGHRACQGLRRGPRYALDAAMRATEGRLIANATGCPEVFSTPYPESVVAAVLDPLALRQRAGGRDRDRGGAQGEGRTDVRVVGQGGDGGPVDIGFACLSGMFERNDDVLYVCYDNEAYMNTGVRAGATPPAARTATTKPVGTRTATRSARATTPLIAMAHEIRTLRRRPSPSCTTSRPRSSARWSSTAPATCTSSCRVRSDGACVRRHDQGRPPCEARRACSLFEGLSTATWSLCGRRSVAACRWRSTCGCSGGSRICSATRRTDVIAQIQAIMDRNIERSGQGGWRSRLQSRSTLSSLANKTGSWRTERPVRADRLPPCSNACPAGENIQQWLYEAEEGGAGYERAWRRIMEDNPFPAVMGRVCYHPCETACNRAQLDEAVGINSVERFVGDEAIRCG